MTADFAKRAITEEGLGADNYPDYLSVSFSGVDATNNSFGPSSLESEEMVRMMDRTLADFMSFVDATVGADSVIHVPSGEHQRACNLALQGGVPRYPPIRAVSKG